MIVLLIAMFLSCAAVLVAVLAASFEIWGNEGFRFILAGRGGMQNEGFLVRCLIRQDLEQVAAIDGFCFGDDGWTAERIAQEMQRRDEVLMTGLVAEWQGEIVGFALFEKHKDFFDLIRLGVHPEYRRRGVATTILRRRMERLDAFCCNQITAIVRERNLPVQLLFRSLGFKATGVNRDFWDNPTEDGFGFSYSFDEAVASGLFGSSDAWQL